MPNDMPQLALRALRWLPPPERLAGPLRLLPESVLRFGSLQVIEQVLAVPLADGRLDEFAGRRIGVEVTDLGLRWIVAIGERRVEVLHSSETAEATVRGTATDLLLPVAGQSVRISARLESGIQDIQAASVQAVVRSFLGGSETIALQANGEGFEAVWKTKQAGLHAIDLSYTGTLPDGSSVQRSAFLTVDVQPPIHSPEMTFLFVVAIVATLLSPVLTAP